MKAWIENIEYHGGTIGKSYTLIPAIDANGSERTLATRVALARDRTLATVFIRNANASNAIWDAHH